METAESDQTFVHPLSNFWNRIPAFWRFQLTGWAAFAAFTFPLKAQLTTTISGALLLSVLRDGSSFLLTSLMREIYRPAFPISHPVTILTLGTAVSLLGGVIQYGFFFAVHRVLPYDDELVFTRAIAFDVFYERTGLLFGWSALYFGIRQMRDGIERDLRLARIESEIRGAELQMLRSQMNPHFLFNALTTVRSGLIARDPELAAVVQNLADYLRFSLRHADDSTVPIGEEFDAMRDYLRVEKARYGEDLEFECHIDEAVRAVPVPGVILQPLVENAIKYGRRTSPPPLRVNIHVSADGKSSLILRVTNTGKWVDATSTRLGLQNLQRRLALIYRDYYRFDTTSRDGQVAVTVTIPRRS